MFKHFVFIAYIFEINNQTRLEQLIKKISSRYSDVAGIYVAHIPIVSDVSQLQITVHTGEVDSYVQNPNLTVADEATVRIGKPMYSCFAGRCVKPLGHQAICTPEGV